MDNLDHQIELLKMLQFTQLTSITPDDLRRSFLELDDEWKLGELPVLTLTQSSFIEQRFLIPTSSGTGVAAHLTDHSYWLRDQDLTDDERTLLVSAGFQDNTLMAEAVLAPKH